MSKLLKINVKSSLGVAVVACLLILTFYAHATGGRSLSFTSFLRGKDTIPSKKIDTLRLGFPKNDSLRAGDSLVPRVDTVMMSSDSLESIITSHAEDSGVIIVAKNQIYLYGKAKTDYKDLSLTAATILYDNETNIVMAYGSTDTTGSIASKPEANQGDIKTISDTIAINMKTGKGRTQNTYLQQGEIFVNARFIKNINREEAFAQDARFTTCNLDTPHFAFRTRRMKIINNKLGVTGRVYPEIESVPIPMVFLPFGLFPLNKARHSGVLLPSFTSSQDFGLGLEGLGYYKVFGEHVDVTTRANLYSYGGWNLNFNSKYIMRYKYTGNLNLTFQNTKALSNSTFSKEEFNSTKSYMINWSHSRDSRARPGTSFSASVNFGSTKFNETLLSNPSANFQNVLTSSVSYSKDWNGKFNMSLNLNHNQNSTSRLVTLMLPTLGLNMTTIYPFQRAEAVGAGKWYEKIGIGYQGTFINQVAFYDTAFNFKRTLDTLQYGAQHSIPITLSLPSLGPFTVSPGISYEEHWYGQKNLAKYDTTTRRIDTFTTKGIFTERQMSFSLGIGTRVFGTYKFPEKSNVIAIRHEMRPSISFSYHPDFAAKTFYDLQVDSTGRTMRVSQYNGNVIGYFGEGKSGSIGFGLDNLLEMKVKDKNADTTNGVKGKVMDKKIKLIEGFGFNGSYNFLADSCRLSDISLYARTTLFEKLNITANATLTPYDVNIYGQRINKLLLDLRHLNFGKITSGNIAMSTSFSSKSKDGKDDKNRQLPIDPFMTPDEQQRQLQFARANPAEFTDFNIPWTLSLSYSLNFYRVQKPDYSGFTTQTTQGFTFNGDFSLTPKWKVGATGAYDISTTSLQQLSTFISREMHCWQLSININPIGLYRSFNISFSPKSGILRDLKINRTRSFLSEN